MEIGIGKSATVYRFAAQSPADQPVFSLQLDLPITAIRLVTMEHRVLVYYCRSLVRELDLGNQRSTIVDRWLPDESSQPKL
jgi:hypothetical protein